MKIFRTLSAACLAAGLIGAALSPAAAHPHVFVDAKAEVTFDASGRISAIRNIWQFDETFTDFAIQGLDVNNDGKLSDAELKPLADINVKSLKEFGFFTYLADAHSEAKFLPPKEYWLEFHNKRLTLFFTLPLAQPMAIGPKTLLEIFDPEYFVAFTFVKNRPIALDHPAKGCAAVFHPPRELDAQTMATLAAIPVDQHDLPPDLVQAASALANSFSITCPGSDAVANAPTTATDAANALASGGLPGLTADDAAATPEELEPAPPPTDPAATALPVPPAPAPQAVASAQVQAGSGDDLAVPPPVNAVTAASNIAPPADPAPAPDPAASVVASTDAPQPADDEARAPRSGLGFTILIAALVLVAVGAAAALVLLRRFGRSA